MKAILNHISPKILVSLQYLYHFHKPLNWWKPKSLNEKINWLKFNSDTSLWTLCADKYRVREYIHQKGLDEMLVKLYGKWDKAEGIEWDKLPNSFVLKTNNGSGDILVCKDKQKLDKDYVVSTYAELLNKNFCDTNAEPHYAAMKPCIIAEELLNNTKQPIETDTLIDYKIWCFNGKPFCIFTCYNRHKHSLVIGTYDTDWNYHPEWSIYTSHYIKATKQLPKPQSLDMMLKNASILSEGIPQVRVDMYEVDGKPYFGELTFTSAGGFMNCFTDHFLLEMGKLVDLRLAPRKK